MAQFMLSVLNHWPAPPPPRTTTPAESATGARGVTRLRIAFEIDAELQLAHPHGHGSLTLRSLHVPAVAVVHEMLRAAYVHVGDAPPFTAGVRELWIRAELRDGSGSGDLESELEFEDAIGLLRALPRLERLVVAGNPAATLRALAHVHAGESPSKAGDDAHDYDYEAARGDGDGAGARVVCPALDTLSVFVDSREDAEAVSETLAARARMGCAVRCVVVPAPLPDAENAATEADIRALEEMVGELVVVDTTGCQRTEVGWWTGRLKEACRENAALGRNLRCEWPRWKYQVWK